MSYPYGYGHGHPNPHVVQRYSNPFAALVMAHGVSSAFSGSSADGVSVVTYESEYGEDYVKDILKLDAQAIENGGQPMALKYDGCDVLIPIPSRDSILATAAKSYKDLGTADNDEAREKAAKVLSLEMWKAHFNKCGHSGQIQGEACMPSLSSVGGQDLNSRFRTTSGVSPPGAGGGGAP